ncbi:hypothetical protein WOLCODRAFT_167951, partial [Wolfiporia cocos MD-104 SS10]
MTPVIEHLLDGREDEDERWPTFKYCTDEARAELSQGQCLVTSVEQAGDNSMEFNDEADLSGQTLVDTSVDGGTLCDDGDKDDESIPGGFRLDWQVVSEWREHVCPIPSAADMIASFARMCASATSSMSGVRPRAVTDLNVPRSPVAQSLEDDDPVESDADTPLPSPSLPSTDVDHESLEVDYVTDAMEALVIRDAVTASVQCMDVDEESREVEYMTDGMSTISVEGMINSESMMSVDGSKPEVDWEQEAVAFLNTIVLEDNSMQVDVEPVSSIAPPTPITNLSPPPCRRLRCPGSLK